MMSSLGQQRICCRQCIAKEMTSFEGRERSIAPWCVYSDRFRWREMLLYSRRIALSLPARSFSKTRGKRACSWISLSWRTPFFPPAEGGSFLPRQRKSADPGGPRRRSTAAAKMLWQNGQRKGQRKSLGSGEDAAIDDDDDDERSCVATVVHKDPVAHRQQLHHYIVVPLSPLAIRVLV